MNDISHKKIILKDTLISPEVFADYYRFGNGEGSSVPLIYYTGGAINEEKYRERMNSTPDNIVHEFRRVLEGKDAKPVDLLISPSPVAGPERLSTILQDYFVHFMAELLPAVRKSKPKVIVCTGFSFGAFLNTYLALNMPEVPGLGIFGGVMMLDAISQSSEGDYTGKRFCVAANFDDPTYGYSEELHELLSSRGYRTDFIKRTGGHAFNDYAENDIVKDVFAFAMATVREG